MAGAWRAAGWLAICLLRPGLGLAGATQHTLTKLTPPPHLERGEPGCVLSKLTLPLVADSGDSEVLSGHTQATPPHATDCTAVFGCCLCGGRKVTQRDS